MKHLNRKIRPFILTVALGCFMVGQMAAQNSISADSTAITGQTQEERILETPFGTFNLDHTTGSYYSVSGDELRKTPGKNLSEALRGRVPGLVITIDATAPGAEGNYSYNLNGVTPFILVDGQPRGLQVDLREVQEVVILNSATFGSLFGTYGNGGLIYVVTKQAESAKPIIEVNYQRGISYSSKQPETLSSFQYAQTVNRALTNDGYVPIYSDADLQAYQDGSDPILHPNVDYQDVFLKNSAPSNYASLNVYGGNEGTSYSAFIGYNDWEGIEKVGQKIDGNNITFRTKIRTKINDLLEAHGSVYGNYVLNDNPSVSANALFRQIANTPPNAFPLKYADTAFIVNNQFTSNLLADMTASGTNTDYEANMIFDFGLDFDFNDYVKGLNYKSYVMYRTFNAFRRSATGSPALYTLEQFQDMTGNDSLGLKLYARENPIPENPSRNNANVLRTFVVAGNFNYSKKLGEGNLNANLNHLLYYRPNNNSSSPDSRNLIFNANAAYTYKNKYTAYTNLNSSSGVKFIDGNKTALFPTFGLSWVASREDFLKDNSLVNYLKIRGSYGVIGTEYTASNYLFLEQWGGSGTPYFGNGQTQQNQFGREFNQTANPGIDWVKHHTFYAGADLRMFDDLNFQFNYFNILTKGYVDNLNSIFSDAVGNNSYLPTINYTEKRNVGFNTSISYNKQFGDLNFRVNGNIGVNKTINERIAETPYPDRYRLEQGRPDDLIFGFESDGLFTPDNIDDALPQFGPLQVGDIKYVDQNGDGIVDNRDRVAIGNNSPRVNYGISLGFDFKGFNLDVVGSGLSGKDTNLNNGSYDYYRHYGLGTYYGSVNQNLPNGNPNPRLSAFQSINNYRNSDYWLIDGGYFRISFAELGYSFPVSFFANSVVDFTKFKLFVRGSNLAVFSKFKDLDPEEPTAGIYKYPMMRNFTAGVSINF